MRRLGFEPESLESFEEAITQPFGMVLVTGPTGSGKTNTLYSAISQINSPDRNIMTVEDQCKKEVHPPVQALVDMGYGPEEPESVRVFQAVGCGACDKMGYKGRVGLYEVMEVTEDLKEMIIQDATSVDLTRKAVQNGMITLRQSGLIKVREGQTTLEEVLRETIQLARIRTSP